jgi:hypothetical protein
LRVLVIGAQGVLGSFIARRFREAGWAVTRGGRRPERAEDFRLVDLDHPESVTEACTGVDLVVSTVRHPALFAERAVLTGGGVLFNLDDLPAAERAHLKDEVPQPRGLVVDRTGLGGVTGLATAELLEEHPEADTLEFGFMVSAKEIAGHAGGIFAHRLLSGAGHFETATVDLPPPFGRRRCLSSERDAAELVGPLTRGRRGRLQLCFLPAAFNALFLALNAFRLASRLPLALFTAGRGAVPTELSRQPTCHWTAVTRAGERLARRIIMGDGDYRSSVEATLVFAEALVVPRGAQPRRSGVFGVDELLTFREILPPLERHGIRACAL